MTNWAEELLAIGLVPLEKSTKTYGNGKITGSVKYWDSKNCKLFQLEKDLFNDKGELKSKFAIETFVPFLANDDKEKCKHESVVLYNLNDLIGFLK